MLCIRFKHVMTAGLFNYTGIIWEVFTGSLIFKRKAQTQSPLQNWFLRSGWISFDNYQNVCVRFTGKKRQNKLLLKLGRNEGWWKLQCALWYPKKHLLNTSMGNSDVQICTMRHSTFWLMVLILLENNNSCCFDEIAETKPSLKK